MDLEARVAALEKKVAELGRQDPSEPEMKHLNTKMANFQKIAEVAFPKNDLSQIPGAGKPNLIKPGDQNPA